MDKYVIAPPSGSTNNSVGASDRPWVEGHFEKLPGINEYLAESTGYGIVSGCEPSISGLTVTVSAGIVHLADGTRKEIASTNITLDAADSTNPRIDLVYIDSTGAVAKITGTAAASPSAPSVPANGVSVAQVSVAANASIGVLTNISKMAFNADDKVKFLFPRTTRRQEQGDCQIIVTPEKVMMIDSNSNKENSTEMREQYEYIISYLKKHNVNKIDVFLLTHYHSDHYGNIANFLAQSEIDFSECEWLIPSNTVGAELKQMVIGYLTGTNYRVLSADETIKLSSSCYVDLMCCNSDIDTYVTTVGVDVNNDNPRSIYALVRHRNVNVLYTGDGYYPETEFVRTHYSLPKINLLKIPHHGVSSKYEESACIAFFKEISPDYAVFNHGWNHFDTNVGGSVLWGEQTRYYPQYASKVGAKVYHITTNDAEFVSDGTYLEHVSKNYPIQSFYNPASITFYVDAAATDIPDGTSEKPFKSINAAIAELPVNAQNGRVQIMIKAGEYNSLVLANYHGQINFYADGDGDITIGRMLFSNCADVSINFTSLTTKQLLIAKSNMTITDGPITLLPNDSWSLEWKNLNGINAPETGYGTDICPLEIIGSTVYVYKMLIDCQSLTSAYNKTYVAHIINSTCSFRSLGVNTITSSMNITHAIRLGRNSIINIREFSTLKNVYCPIFFLTAGVVFNLEKTSSSAVSDNTFTATNIFNMGDSYETYRYNIKIMKYNYPGPSMGATGSRPNSKIVIYGNTYYDTTLNALLMWNGTAWLNTATGNTI